MATLKGTPHEMFMRAWAQRGARQKTLLANGLHIELYAGAQGDVHLCLWRKAVAPVLREWTTVLDAWPTSLPDPRPAANALLLGTGVQRRCCLVALWTRPRSRASVEPAGISAEMQSAPLPETATRPQDTNLRT